ncbi:hypothetical protein K227x_14380 [Rubripirellula lacrimiformis]|uniref:Uncharacterized protein n=1 Tax=Rubripirellula lacrimiformis TaxID=1930273 RepID=A0A517N7D5_9BACT|nr:hypothetical protein K227x_14380 [Rubripirellula lacrimiformis]
MRLKQRGCAQNPQTITRLMRGEQVVFLEIRRILIATEVESFSAIRAGW